MADFHIQIISPERVEFEGKIRSLVAPGEDGFIGILANHAPLLANLKPGPLSISGGRDIPMEKMEIEEGGFLEVHENKVILLANKLKKTPIATGRQNS
ncbi:MAG: F0F1 ATP synthase subunit epsilon [Candidatus Sumerlaeia bacterium]